MSGKAIQYKAIYNRKNSLNSKNEGLVQVEAYKDAIRAYFSTGIYLKQEHWSKEKGKIIKRPDSGKLNDRLATIIEKFKSIEFDNNRSNPDFTVNDLRAALDQEDNSSFTEYALEQLNKQKKAISPATYTKYLNSINTFIAFAGSQVHFTQLNNKLIDDFKHYLVKKDIGANTQKIYFKHLGMYAKMAVRHGILEFTKNPFVDIKIAGQKTSRNNLNEHDLKKLEKLKFKATEKHLELIRDLFLFQCYTGLRFSDASRLNHSHIYTGPDGYEIRMVSEKEKKTVALPLRLLFPLNDKTLSRPELLIKKYWRTDDKPFFLAYNSKNSKAANNQYTNRELKEIQAKAKLQTPLTNHVGRHTFATFLIWRVPLPIVQELLQHSKVETTMLYVHVGSEAVKQHLKKVIDWV